MTKAQGQGFTQGYMCAVAVLMRNHAEDSYGIELIRASGITLKDCHKHGVDPFDLKMLVPLYKTIKERS